MNIVLGVTGGIAAYKAVLLARLLVEAGHELHIVPTEDALKFVGKPTWEAISRNTVTTSVHEDVPEVRHVALGQNADLIIIAPATANTIAKMTAGIADDLLGTTLLASKAPVLVAPAMHTEMWEHASTRTNIATLKERGVNLVGPESGRLTGNDSGPGRMSEPETIFAEANRILEISSASDPQTNDNLAGVSILVTAGGTREPIDPVRYIGNRSSGKQGVALAEEAAKRGAQVHLIVANISAEVLNPVKHFPNITVTHVGSTADLQRETVSKASASDIICMVAAVSDYRVADVSEGKIRKEDSPDGEISLQLVQNPDILQGLVESRSNPKQVIVGFAAETGTSKQEVIDRGRSKALRKGADLLAVNAVGWDEGFEQENNALFIVDSAGVLLSEISGSKNEVAAHLLDEITTART